MKKLIIIIVAYSIVGFTGFSIGRRVSQNSPLPPVVETQLTEQELFQVLHQYVDCDGFFDTYGSNVITILLNTNINREKTIKQVDTLIKDYGSKISRPLQVETVDEAKIRLQKIIDGHRITIQAEEAYIKRMERKYDILVSINKP